MLALGVALQLWLAHGLHECRAADLANDCARSRVLLQLANLLAQITYHLELRSVTLLASILVLLCSTVRRLGSYQRD